MGCGCGEGTPPGPVSGTDDAEGRDRVYGLLPWLRPPIESRRGGGRPSSRRAGGGGESMLGVPQAELLDVAVAARGIPEPEGRRSFLTSHLPRGPLQQLRSRIDRRARSALSVQHVAQKHGTRPDLTVLGAAAELETAWVGSRLVDSQNSIEDAYRASRGLRPLDRFALNAAAPGRDHLRDAPRVKIPGPRPLPDPLPRPPGGEDGGHRHEEGRSSGKSPGPFVPPESACPTRQTTCTNSLGGERGARFDELGLYLCNCTESEAAILGFATAAARFGAAVWMDLLDDVMRTDASTNLAVTPAGSWLGPTDVGGGDAPTDPGPQVWVGGVEVPGMRFGAADRAALKLQIERKLDALTIEVRTEAQNAAEPLIGSYDWNHNYAWGFVALPRFLANAAGSDVLPTVNDPARIYLNAEPTGHMSLFQLWALIEILSAFSGPLVGPTLINAGDHAVAATLLHEATHLAWTCMRVQHDALDSRFHNARHGPSTSDGDYRGQSWEHHFLKTATVRYHVVWGLDAIFGPSQLAALP
jgi:hypothetical protein